MRRRLCSLVLALAALASGARAQRPTPAPSYQVYAVQYGVLPGFPLRGLMEGGDSSRIDISMMVWLATAPGRNVLVDAGFYRDSLMQRWRPKEYLRPDSAVMRAGVRPESVTDLVLTHLHWDHADGVDLFPNAQVWVQKAEYEYYGAPERQGARTGVTAQDVAVLDRLKAQGRLHLVDGDARQFLPGITAYTGGKHTFESQYLGVHTAAGIVVLASDNAYLFRNLELHRPIAQTLDRESNLRAQERMLQLAASPRLVVPGHDPEVFLRFPAPGKGVAQIR